MGSPALAPLLRAFGVRPLFRHTGRALLTVLGVAAGVGVYIGNDLAARSSIQSFARTAREVAGPARLRLHHRPLPLPESLLVSLRRFDREADFYPALQAPARARTPDGTPFTILGADLVGDPRFAPARERPSAGAAAPRLAEVRSVFHPGVLFLPAPLAERLGVARHPVRPAGAGGALSARDSATGPESLAVVVGPSRYVFPVATAGGATLLLSAAQSIAFLDIAAFQERFGRVGTLDWIDIEPHRGVDRERLRRDLAAAVAGSDFRVEPPEERATQMERMLDSYRRNLKALSLVSLLVGMLLAYNALLSTMLQRRGELALLRALGASRGLVALLTGVEAIVVGLLGGALGVLLGRGLAEGALRLTSRTVGELYARTLPAPLELTPGLALFGVALGLGTALAAALGPAREAARVRPLEFLRDEPHEIPYPWHPVRRLIVPLVCVALAVYLIRHPDGLFHGYRGYIGATAVLLAGALTAQPALSGVARLLRPLLRRILPPAGQLAYATALAARRRLGVSVAALLLAFAVVWGMNALVESFRETVDAWADVTLRADLWVTPQSRSGSPVEGDMPAAWRARLAALPEVAAVDAYRVREILIGGDLCFLAAGESDVLRRYGFLPMVHHADPGTILRGMRRGERTLLVSEPLARRRGIPEGSRFPLDTPTGRHEYRVLAIYRDYSSDRGYVLLDRDTYLRDFGDSLVTTFGVYLRPGIQRAAGAAVVAGAFPASDLVRVTDTRSIREEVRRVMSDTFAVTDALTVVAAIVALLSVMGALAALVLERTREIGVLKAVGASEGQVLAALLLEGALLAFVGLLLGALTGGLLSAVLVSVLNRESFGWTLALVTPWRRVLLLAALLFAAAVLSVAPSARRASRIPPREAMSRA